MKEQLDALINQLVDRGILYDEALAEFEKRFIRKVLDTYRGNQSRAAEVLGIHRNTLSRKLDLYRLDRNDFRRRSPREARRRR